MKELKSEKLWFDPFSFSFCGWTEAELEGRPKGDPEKLRIARLLRRETTVTLQWIARTLRMGATKTYLSHLLYWHRKEKKKKRRATA